MNLFDELKRRNVFRVGAAYAVVGWLIAQVADTFFARLGLPDWTVTFVMVLVVIGLPIALLLAWAFEMTPEGVKKTAEVDKDASITASTGQKLNRLTVVALVLALAFIAWQNLGDGPVTSPATNEARATIAVLPFVNMSSDPEQEFFSDGISEEILNVLTGIDGLRVTSRSSAFALKGQDLSVPEMAARLGVAYVLEGSVRKSGDQVRVTAQLIEVDTDSHLWSDTYDSELSNIFAVQDRIASSIASALRLNLAPVTPGEGRPTENMQAYQLYLKGRGQWLDRKVEAIYAGIANLERALDLDPDFALAHANLAMAYAIADSWTPLEDEVIVQKISAHAMRALLLDPGAAEAWLAFSHIVDSSDISTHYMLQVKAHELAPQNAQVLNWKAITELAAGQSRKALETTRMATTLDPLVGHFAGWHAATAFAAGEFDEALDKSDDAIGLGWTNHGGVPGDVHWMRGEFDDALLTMNEARENFASLAASVFDVEVDLEGWRQFGAWLAIRDAGGDAGPMPPLPEDVREGGRGLFGIARRAEDEALIELSAQDGFNPGILGLASSWSPLPGFAFYRNSAPFKQYIRDNGLIEFWRQFGWPDLCRPLGADDFECD